jgi:hypothetical protein
VSTYLVRDVVDGILLPLPALIQRLPGIQVRFWAFKEVTFVYGNTFGIPLVDFERLTKELWGGFIVADSDFKTFLRTDFQMRDGLIESIGLDGSSLLTIECFDVAEWEIATESPEISAQLEQRGFQRER